MFFFFFFFNDTATTEIYTLSLHDALPIYLVNARSLSVYAQYRLLASVGVLLPTLGLTAPEEIGRAHV